MDTSVLLAHDVTPEWVLSEETDDFMTAAWTTQQTKQIEKYGQCGEMNKSRNNWDYLSLFAVVCI